MSSVSQATSVPSPSTVSLLTLGPGMQVNKLLLYCCILAPIACSLVHAAPSAAGLSSKSAQETELC